MQLYLKRLLIAEPAAAFQKWILDIHDDFDEPRVFEFFIHFAIVSTSPSHLIKLFAFVDFETFRRKEESHNLVDDVIDQPHEYLILVSNYCVEKVNAQYAVHSLLVNENALVIGGEMEGRHMIRVKRGLLR